MSKGLPVFLALGVSLVLLPGSAFPHGGGLDGNGCHHDRKRGGYHCHGGSSGGQSSSGTEIREQDPQPLGASTGEPLTKPSRIDESALQNVEQCAEIVKRYDRGVITGYIREKRVSTVTVEVNGKLYDAFAPDPAFMTGRSLCANLVALHASPVTFQKEIEQHAQAEKLREKERKEQTAHDAEVRKWQERARQGRELEARQARTLALQREAEERIRIEQSGSPEEKRALKERDCRTDLQCWGSEKSVNAEVACKPVIERLAKHQAEWTDGWGEQKFSRLLWKDQQRGIISYIGDKIKFQNGFGAWTYHIYRCDYDTQKETVVDVHAQPGRLP